MERQNELFKQSVRAGSRTYFMDVKETKEGKPFLSFVESRKKDEGFEKTRMLIFQDHLPEIIKGLNSVQTFMVSYKPSENLQNVPQSNVDQEEEDLPF